MVFILISKLFDFSPPPEPEVEIPNIPPPDDHLYIFKPPPPYPGTPGGSNGQLPTLDMTRLTSADIPVAVTKEQSPTIKMGTSVSRVPPKSSDNIQSGNSRSVSAVSIVSAEVHNVPTVKDSSGAISNSEQNLTSSNGAATNLKVVSNPVPKTNGLLKEGNGARKSGTGLMHLENKVLLYAQLSECNFPFLC